MPDTETRIAGTRGRRIPRSPPALQEARSWQRQDRRPLFPSRPPPAAHARCHPGPDGPVPARRGPQRALPQARPAPYRRGVGLGPRTRRPGTDTPCAVVPPSSRIPGHRPVLVNRILAPARLRLRCDAACWLSDANTTVPGRTARTRRQCAPRRAPSWSPATALRHGSQFSGHFPLATPALSTGLPAGPMSARLKGAGATTRRTATTSQKRTSGSGPSAGTGSASSTARIHHRHGTTEPFRAISAAWAPGTALRSAISVPCRCGSTPASPSSLVRRATSASRNSAFFAARRAWFAASTAASRLRRASLNCHFNEPAALRAATSAHFNSSARASAASARSRVCSYSRRHQAFDLHVLHGPAAIPQRRVHAAPAIGGGIASITYWALAMGIVQVPSETRCASPLTPESVSRSRPTPDA